MFAQDFVDLYLRQVSAPVDRTLVLETLNWVQNKIAGMDTEFLRILPDPYFITTAATYVYTANDVCKSAVAATPGASVGDVRVIREIYRRDAILGGSNDFGRHPYPSQFVSDLQGGRMQAPITCPGSNIPGSDDCQVFWDLNQDPGDQTTLWRARAYCWPTQLTDNQLILIPEDFCRDLLLQAVKFQIEDMSYGSAPGPLSMENEMMKRFKTKFSSPTIYGRIKNAPPINA